MTGTGWDPVFTGTPVRLNIQELSFRKYKICFFFCFQESIGATAALHMHWFGKNESLSQSGCLWKEWRDKKNQATTINPVPSTDSELASGKIHSGQLLRGMHKNKILHNTRRGRGGEFSKRTHRTQGLHLYSNTNQLHINHVKNTACVRLNGIVGRKRNLCNGFF